MRPRNPIYGERSAVAAPVDTTDELCTRSFTTRIATIDKQSRSIDAVIATEAPAAVFDWESWSMVDEVLRMDGVRLPSQLPLLDAHSRWSSAAVVGSTRNIRVEGDKLVGRNVVSSAASLAETWTKIEEGHLTDNSVGYRVYAHTDIPAGQTQTVNGRQYTAGARTLRISTDWEPKENSLVPIGADAMAKMRQQRGGPAPTFQENAMTFEQFVKSRGQDAAALTDASRAALHAEWERQFPPTPATQPAVAQATPAPVVTDPVRATAPTATATAPAPSPDIATITREAVAAERQRAEAIRNEAAGLNIDPMLVARCVNSGVTVEQARGEFLAALRASRPGPVGSPAIHVPDREAGLNRETLAAGLMLRMGMTVQDAALAERAEPYRHYSALDICRECLRMDGVPIPHSKRELVSRAFSTVSLPSTFAAVANKRMMEGFQQAPNTSLQWCAQEDVPDFKSNTRVRHGEGEALQLVNDAGKIEKLTVREWAESYSLATYAGSINLTRKDVINDDLGLFARLPLSCGAAALAKIDDVLYTALLANAAMNDAVALFHATHSNLMTGGTTVLSPSSLSTAKQKLRQQVGLDGKRPLNITGMFLIVPPELEGTGRSLIESEKMFGTTTADAPKGDANVHRNSLKLIVEPRLSNSSFTGYSTTAWYVAGSPIVQPTMMIGFLQGTGRAPIIENVDPDSDELGTILRVVLDVGCKALDFRGMVKSNGA